MSKDNDFQYAGSYLGDLISYTLHKRSGKVIKTDAPIDNQGEGRHFSPTDLLATALGTCIVTVMALKAKNELIIMDGASFEVKKVMAGNPRRISEVCIRIHMPDVDYTEHQKKILEKAAHHCPVKNSLHPDVKEVIEIIWKD